LVFKNPYPGIDAQQKGCPAGQNDAQQQNVSNPRVGAGNTVGNGIAHDKGQKGGSGSCAKRTQVGGKIEFILEEEQIVADIQYDGQLFFRI
jgi:hypothetical protein